MKQGSDAATSPSEGVDRTPMALGAGLSVLAVCGFWLAAAPSLTFRDSGLFALAIGSWGIPHPPGAPTYVILASLFRWVSGIDDPARAGNLFSGLCGGITVGLVGVFVWGLAGMLNLGKCRTERSMAAIAAALVLAGSRSFIELSTTTEQYTLLTALNMAILVLSLRAWQPGARLGLLGVVLGLLWGLAVGNHPSQIHLVLYFGALCFAFWMSRGRGAMVLATGIVAGCAAGLCIYLFVPLRSRAEPLLDWGNVQTWDRFLWAIRREQWPRRAWSASPHGFTLEWLKTYRLLSEVGLAALLFAAAGCWTLWRRGGRIWLLLIGLMVFPYLFGIYAGHKRQVGIGITYVRHYGLGDWHLPLYMATGIGAGFGLLAVVHLAGRDKPWLGRLVGHAVVVALSIWTLLAVAAGSLASLRCQDTYSAALLHPLPADAIIAPSGDSIAFNLGYHDQVQAPADPRWVGLGAPSPDMAISKAMKEGGWNAAARAAWFEEAFRNPEKNVLRAPVPSAEEAAARPLFAEFAAVRPETNVYMLPVGFLVKVMDSPTTDSEVLEADRDWIAFALSDERQVGQPPRPEEVFHDKERTAWSQLWQRRGDYFYARLLWEKALESYRQALAFEPSNALYHYRIGDCLERLGRLDEAQPFLRNAVRISPSEAGPYLNLALGSARTGDFRAAERLLRMELRRNPGNQSARQVLEQVQRDLAAQAPR